MMERAAVPLLPLGPTRTKQKKTACPPNSSHDSVLGIRLNLEELDSDAFFCGAKS